MTQQYDLVLVKTPPHPFHDFVEVVHKLRNGHGCRRDIGMERASGSTLLPVHNQEMLFEGGIVVAKERRFAGAGSSMQDDQRRTGLGYGA